MMYAAKYKHIQYGCVSYLHFSPFAFDAEFSSYFIRLRENLNTHCNCSLITSLNHSCLGLQIYVLLTKFAIYWELKSIANVHFEIIWIFREKAKREHEGKLINHLDLRTFNPIPLVYTIYF